MSLLEVLLAMVVIAITSESAIDIWLATVQAMRTVTVETTAVQIAENDAERIMDGQPIATTVVTPVGSFAVEEMSAPEAIGQRLVVKLGKQSVQLDIIRDGG